MNDLRGGGGGGKDKKKMFYYQKRAKFCRFCKDNVGAIDYKEVDALKRYTGERGRIVGARVTGTCKQHQKQLGQAIKRARHLALMPFVTD